MGIVDSSTHVRDDNLDEGDLVKYGRRLQTHLPSTLHFLKTQMASFERSESFA